jgi:membrane-associated phospholipid phosphatase
VLTDRRGRLWAAVAAVVGLILVTADLVFAGALRDLDGVVSRTVVAHGLEGWQPALEAMTYPGQRGYVAVPLLVVTALAAWRTRSTRPLVVVAGTLVATTVVVGAMKVGFGRTAPSSGHDLLGVDALSYPSGHAVNTVIIWTLVLRMLIGLYGRRATALTHPLARVTLVAVISLANAAAMVGLNYHWVTDMLAGWLIGIVLALVVPSPLPAGYRPDVTEPARSRRGSGHPVPSA